MMHVDNISCVTCMIVVLHEKIGDNFRTLSKKQEKPVRSFPNQPTIRNECSNQNKHHIETICNSRLKLQYTSLLHFLSGKKGL
ncbi:hypothetical protein Hanom_Chr04g00363911 [Helianthus anomalus]